MKKLRYDDEINDSAIEPSLFDFFKTIPDSSKKIINADHETKTIEAYSYRIMRNRLDCCSYLWSFSIDKVTIDRNGNETVTEKLGLDFCFDAEERKTSEISKIRSIRLNGVPLEVCRETAFKIVMASNLCIAKIRAGQWINIEKIFEMYRLYDAPKDENIRNSSSREVNKDQPEIYA